MAEDLLQALVDRLVNLPNTFWPDFIAPNLSYILYIILLAVIGYIVGNLLKFVVVKFLGLIGLKKITTRSWTESMLKVTGYRGNIIELIGDLVKWTVYILFFALIIQTIGFPGIADIFTQLAIWIPKIIVAILVVIIGFMIADFFGRVFEEASARYSGEEGIGKLVSGFVKYSVAMVIIIIALSLLGLDTAALLVLLIIMLSAALIMFVFGAKDIMPNIVAGMQLKEHVKIGDRVKTGSYSGTVEKMEATSIILRVNGKNVILKNSYVMDHPIEKIKRKG